MELDVATSVFAGTVLFVAYLVRGVAGFGSGLIAVPLLAFVFPVKIVVPVVVLLDYLGSASQGLRNHKQIAWREQLPLIPFTLIGVALGLTLLKSLSAATLAAALGVFVIVYAIYQLLPLPAPRGSRVFAAPCGLLGGGVGTLFGTGGPFYVIYFGLRALDKRVFRATFASNFLIDGTIRLAAYASFGFLAPDVLLASIAALPIVALALWSGGRVHSTISREGYARMISALLLASGAVLLMKA